MQIDAGFIEKGSSEEDRIIIPNVYDERVLSRSPTPRRSRSPVPPRKKGGKGSKKRTADEISAVEEEVEIPPHLQNSGSDYEPAHKKVKVTRTYGTRNKDKDQAPQA
ncbi:hypothetical protein MPER_05936 [Moniliophthora perniciosa FA553]|nr:hypothetical protein MPER_05936 [Moniliophthora perniciosa FA553]